VGKPLLFEEYADRPAGARQRREVTDRVMEAIRELSGQEFVPMYASARKEQLAAASGSGGQVPPDHDPVV
jgi:1-acyl-sn-glycerol-3-phosphate acyltransferase